MPELPEVEFVVRSLNRLVCGKRIAAADLYRPRLAPETPPDEFRSGLAQTVIQNISRRGKHILVELDNGLSLIVHLRMSGRFLLLSADDANPKFTHAEFHFDDRSRLVFVDQRHFGFMKLVETIHLPEARELRKLAPEPFGESFSIRYFRSVLANSKRSVKELLIDQTKVCGLGNIYASEAMFLARVHPETPAEKISMAKARSLRENIKGVLCEAVDMGNLLEVDPRDIGGSIYGSGSTDVWRVYGREGQPCPRCGREIKRISQAGRSTFYCSACQRRHRRLTPVL